MFNLSEYLTSLVFSEKQLFQFSLSGKDEQSVHKRTDYKRKGKEEFQIVLKFELISSVQVTLHTTAGDVEIELWSKEAPLACRNFVQLCMEGYYNGTHFHRLVKGSFLNLTIPLKSFWIQLEKSIKIS